MKNVSNAVFCFLISFYGLLKGYLCELTLFDLFGCTVVAETQTIENCRERNFIPLI